MSGTNAWGCHAQVFNYDYLTGNVTQSMDANSQKTFYTYNHPFHLLTDVQYPDGGETQYCYTDWGGSLSGAACSNSGPFQVYSAAKRDSGTYITSVTTYDGLGRATRDCVTSLPTPICTDTIYDGLGQVWQVSNPYQGGSPTDWTAYLYDPLGRKIQETKQDSSTLSWCYDRIANAAWSSCPTNQSTVANATWVNSQDEAGHIAQHVSDGMGHLAAVMEQQPSGTILGLETDYTYNALNDLTYINQKGTSGDVARTRQFSYDSLSRLTSSTNPETGTIVYSYLNPDSSLCSGDPSLPCSNTDARNITTSYTYDALNRMTHVQAPGINYQNVYDASSWFPNNHNGIGRLIEVTNLGVSDKQFSYDVMGRLNWQSTGTPSSRNNTGIIETASYDLAGYMTDFTYPDGRHIQQASDGAGRLCSVSEASSGLPTCTPSSYTYFGSTSYEPSGALTSAAYGNGLTETSSYNNRLQPVEISVQNPAGNKYMDKQYCYGPATALCPTSQPSPNNGNILAVLNAIDSTRSQGYSYDGLNRLANFSNGSGSMSQTYTTDSFGNMSVTGGTLVDNLHFLPNNRIDPSANPGDSYDAAGNLTQVPLPISGSQYYNYDSLGQIASVGDNPNSPSAWYTYDGDRSRVRKDTSSGWTEYISFGGVPVAEKSANGWSDYIFANGKRIARIDPTVNLLPYSQQLANPSAWNGYCGNLSDITANTSAVTAPDGTQTATAFALPNPKPTGCSADIPAVGLWQYMPGTLTAGNTYTVSIWARGASGGETMMLGLNDYAWMVPTITNTWQRYTFTFSSISSTAAGSFDFEVRNSSPGTTIYLWGAQLEQASSASAYSATGSTTEAVHYYSSDHIGTTSVVTDAAGGLQNDSDYYPYGEEVPFASADPNHFKFTGKERDPETGNDYFGARYYTSGIGRFMSPDWSAKVEPVPYSKLDDPQTLNLYAYVRNNPISNVDLDGHATQQPPPNPSCGGREDSKKCQAAWNAKRDSNDAQTAQQQGFLKWIGSYIYFKGEKGAVVNGESGDSFSLNLGVAKAKVDVNKDMIEDTRHLDGSRKIERVKDSAVGVEIPGVGLIGVSKETSGEHGHASESGWHLFGERGHVSASSGQVGWGGEFCHGVCGGFEVGIEAGKIYKDYTQWVAKNPQYF